DQQWQPERDTDPETPSHQRLFLGRFVLCRDKARLQGHAADRTTSGTITEYLRVHRTDVLDLGPVGRRHGLVHRLGTLRTVQLAPGIGAEALGARWVGKVEFLSVVLERGWCRGGIHRHTTNRIDDTL